MRPTAVPLYIASGWCALGAACAFVPALGPAWMLSGSIAAAILLVDLLTLTGEHNVELERHVDGNLPISAWSPVTLTVTSRRPGITHLDIFDHVPTSFHVRGQPSASTQRHGQRTTIQYEVKPVARGDNSFAGTDLLVLSNLGLWKRRFFLPGRDEVRVYPNFAEVAHYTLLARNDNLEQLGIRHNRRRGQGNDFLELREYREGDTFRQIDWKATSKRQKLISREYHDERDQQLIFLVDCGRRMRQIEDGQAHLDQALNAMLLLTYVAARQGDAVGFLAFGGADKWVKPRKGANTVNHILGQAYDLPSSNDTADYLSVARRLLEMQRRRALVVIMSNTRNEDLDDLLQAIGLMSRRHLVVLGDLLEPGLERVMHSRVTTLDRALCFQEVLDYLERRRKNHELLTHAGAVCFDTNARELPARLVNRYLDIKRTGSL